MAPPSGPTPSSPDAIGGYFPAPDLRANLTSKRLRLQIMYHAFVCTRFPSEACGVIGCEEAKKVYEHVKRCREPRGACANKLCDSTRWVLSHWNRCRQNDCPLCASMLPPPEA